MLVLPNPASAISTRFTSPLKLFEYMAAGRPIVASRPAVDSRGAARRGRTRCSSSRAIRRRSPRRSSGCWTIRRSAARLARAARDAASAVHVGRGAPSGSRRCSPRCVAAALMISESLLALVRCPDCHGALAGRRRCARVPAAAAGAYDSAVDGLSRPAAARGSSPSRRSTSTRRCTPTRATSGCRRRCSDRRSATTCCARSSRRSRTTSSSISAAAAAARCCGTATGGRRPSASTSARSSPRRRGATVDLLLGDLRRLPFADGTFTKAFSLDVLEHLSPEALRGMLAEAARVLAPGGALFVYTHVRKNAPIAAGLRWINALARRLERVGLIDMRQERLRKSDHLNPLPTSRSSSRSAPTAGFRIARIRYYTPIVGGFVENILMRMAERAMARRAAQRLAPRPTCATAPTRARIREARTRGEGSGSPSSPTTYACAARAVVRDEAGPAAVRPDHVGAVLRAAGEGEGAIQFGQIRRRLRIASCDDADPLLRDRPDRARHERRIGPRHGGGRRTGGARARGPRARDAGRRSLPARPGATGSRCRRRSGAKELRWARRGAVRRLAAELAPDVDHRAVLQLRRRRHAAPPRAVGALAVLEVNAPVDRYPGSPKALLDRALLVEPMRRWRERHLRAAPTSSSRRARRSSRRTRRASKVVELEWGADTERFQPGAAGPSPFARPRRRRSRCLPARSAAGTAPIHLVARDPRAARARSQRHRRGVHRRRAGACRACARPPTGSTASSSPAPLPHDRMPACLAAADIGVAPFDLGRARAAGARVLLVAAEDLRVHGRGPAGGRAGSVDRIPALVGTSAKGCSTIRAARRARGRARTRLTDPELRRGSVRAARERAVRDYSWAAHCGALDGAMRRGTGRRAHGPAHDFDAHPARDRRLSARLRRQRLEHVRAGARAARARARRHRRPAAARRTGRGVTRSGRTTASRHRVRRSPRRRCRTSATTSRTSGSTALLARLSRRRSSRANGSTSSTAST